MWKKDKILKNLNHTHNIRKKITNLKIFKHVSNPMAFNFKNLSILVIKFYYTSVI